MGAYNIYLKNNGESIMNLISMCRESLSIEQDFHIVLDINVSNHFIKNIWQSFDNPKHTFISKKVIWSISWK